MIINVEVGMTWGSPSFGIGYIMYVFENGNTWTMRTLCLTKYFTLGVFLKNVTKLRVQDEAKTIE